MHYDVVWCGVVWCGVVWRAGWGGRPQKCGPRDVDVVNDVPAVTVAGGGIPQIAVERRQHGDGQLALQELPVYLRQNVGAETVVRVQPCEKQQIVVHVGVLHVGRVGRAEVQPPSQLVPRLVHHAGAGGLEDRAGIDEDDPYFGPGRRVVGGGDQRREGDSGEDLAPYRRRGVVLGLKRYGPHEPDYNHEQRGDVLYIAQLLLFQRNERAVHRHQRGTRHRQQDNDEDAHRDDGPAATPHGAHPGRGLC